MKPVLPPATPCGSCPYRRDVPSGVWHETEYDKLPEYDNPTQEQPVGVFLCHQQNGRLCAGWVAVHDMSESLALRLACSLGMISESDTEAVLNYRTTVPLFGSGAEAAEHGKKEIDRPGDKAVRTMSKIGRVRSARRRA